MPATYTAGATPRDTVRLLIHDTNVDKPLFEDAEIDVFLALESNDVRYAAAQGLDTLAADQARVLKVIQVFDLRLEGDRVAKALMASAQRLRDVADREPFFDWAEWVTSPAEYRERVLDQLYRNAALLG